MGDDVQAPAIAVVIGTRPEAIKLAPVIRALDALGERCKVFSTGQHRELLAMLFDDLRLTFEEDLAVMTVDQDLAILSGRILTGVRDILRRHHPVCLVVQGDTTTVAMGALAAFYEHIPVAHVEAGLRTGCSRDPFPEEMNRRLVACLADHHFAHTEGARQNLLREGVDDERILVVGNTVIDSLLFARRQLAGNPPRDRLVAEALDAGRDVVLVTGHRRENFGLPLESVCRGLRRLASALGERVEIIYPLHPNPHVRSTVVPLLASLPNVRLIEPLSYLDFIDVMIRSTLIVTDSGGVQEEAATLGIPVLVTRNTCERPEAVEAGVSQVVGPDEDRLFQSAHQLLTQDAVYEQRAVPTRVFGDGRAGERIAHALIRAYRDRALEVPWRH